MIDFKIAAQLYTIRDLLQNKSKKEIHEVLKQVKEIGYSSVQISAVGEVDRNLAQVYKDVCKDLELDICATHTSYEKLDAELDWIIEYHKMWDCPKIGLGYLPRAFWNMDGISSFIEWSNKIGEKLSQNGQTLIYHNHKFEFEKYDGKTMMQRFLEGFDPRYVEFEIDTYWVQAGGGNPADWIDKTSGRMTVVHFKDFRIKDDNQQFSEIGRGNLDWDSIIKACSETGVKYAAVEQDSFTDDPIKSLETSYNFLKNKGLS